MFQICSSCLTVLFTFYSIDIKYDIKCSHVLIITFTFYIIRSPQEVPCISHNAPLPDDVKTEVEETPSEVSAMVIQHAFSPGVEVLARWSDGILYLGNVVKVWCDER